MMGIQTSEGTMDDGAYLTLREHMRQREEQDRRLNAMEVEMATMRAKIAHIPDEMHRLTEAVNTSVQRMNDLAARVAQPASSSATDSTLLTMHRLLDQLASRAGGGGHLAERILFSVVCIALGGGSAFLAMAIPK